MGERKVLLQINVCCNMLSTGKIAEDIGKLAISNGYESYITYSKNYVRPSVSKTIKIQNDISFWFDVVERMLFDNYGLCKSSNFATAKLIKDIENINPSIIHFHTVHFHQLNNEMLLSYLSHRGIPIVYTLHDCWPFTGNCTYFDTIGCDKWKTHCSNCPEPRSYKNSLFYDRTSKNYDIKKRLFNQITNMTIVPVSYWLEGYVRQSFLKDKRIEVIHNGIDLDLFKPSNNDDILKIRSKFGIGDKKLLLGVASDWSPRKGFDDFIRLSSHLDEKKVILLLGLNNKQIKNLPSNIIGLNRTTNVKEMADLYSAADLFVNPTYQDNYPTVNLEAIACGTPIVTYRTGGSVEAVSENTGFIVEKGNINGLIDVTNTVSRIGKEKYAIPCRIYAETYFDKNKNFKNYINIYDDLLMGD